MIGRLRERLAFAAFTAVHRKTLRGQVRWQERRLVEMVRHAHQHVSLWKQLMSSAGVDPDDIKTLADIVRLPITNKQTYLGRMVEEYIDMSQPSRSAWYVTSGTSGLPFKFLMNEHAVRDAYVDFASLRFLWPLGYPVHSFQSTKMTRIKIVAPTSEFRQFVPVADYLSDPLKTLQSISQFDPAILSAYPSILLDMARHIVRDSTIERPRPRFVLAFGETLFPSVRSFVSDTLQCEIYNRYGMEEIGVVGVECAMHDGFHINTEAVIIEITNDAFEPVPPGTRGRVVATDLYNFGMPFIRYDSGDVGTISIEPCACGLQSPRIWIEGRFSAYLEFSGRPVHHLEFDGAMDSFMNYIYQYQIVKTGEHELIARIVPGSAFNNDIPSKVKSNLKRLVGDHVSVQVEITDSIAMTPRGKCRIVVDATKAVR